MRLYKSWAICYSLATLLYEIVHSQKQCHRSSTKKLKEGKWKFYRMTVNCNPGKSICSIRPHIVWIKCMPKCHWTFKFKTNALSDFVYFPLQSNCVFSTPLWCSNIVISQAIWIYLRIPLIIFSFFSSSFQLTVEGHLFCST